MTNKLKELMELSNAVDTICKSVEKDNAAKRKTLERGYAVRWRDMWDCLDAIKPAVEMLRPKQNCVRIGKYEYGYPFGWCAMGANGLTFILNSTGPVKVFMDVSGGWKEVRRCDFPEMMVGNNRVCTELLLSVFWDEVYPEMQTDIERRLAENIKQKIRDAEHETKELDRKIAEIGG